MRSKSSAKDLNDNSFYWFCVKLEALKKCVELSNDNFVPYCNAFKTVSFFNLLFLFRLVETELHGSFPLRGGKATCVSSF